VRWRRSTAVESIIRDALRATAAARRSPRALPISSTVLFFLLRLGKLGRIDSDGRFVRLSSVAVCCAFRAHASDPLCTAASTLAQLFSCVLLFSGCSCCCYYRRCWCSHVLQVHQRLNTHLSTYNRENDRFSRHCRWAAEENRAPAAVRRCVSAVARADATPNTLSSHPPLAGSSVSGENPNAL
jgi:hypothetical protein